MSNTEINLAKKDKRIYERVIFPFPIKISNELIGETYNLSETGLCITCDKSLDKAQVVSVQIQSPFCDDLFFCHARLIWERTNSNKDRYLCGVQFLRLGKKELQILREIIYNCSSLNQNFVKLTEDFRVYLSSLKRRLDHFDSSQLFISKGTDELAIYKTEVYPELNKHFQEIWGIFKNFSAPEYKLHKKYYQLMLTYFLLDIVEVNRFANKKPLGYAGDFILINYYYDFYKEYLGSSSYEKLINHYSLNRFVSHSVVSRKEFFKNEILRVINSKDPAYILSVGCGSARELIELLKDNLICRELYFDCLDFEPAALNYVKNEIQKIDETNRKKVQLRFLEKNIIELTTKNNNIENFYNGYDLIYSAGLFDYLKDRIAKRVLENLCKYLKKDSKLIITNADINSPFDYERAYYEILAEWELINRSQSEMFDLAAGLNGSVGSYLEQFNTPSAFIFLTLVKNDKIAH